MTLAGEEGEFSLSLPAACSSGARGEGRRTVVSYHSVIIRHVDDLREACATRSFRRRLRYGGLLGAVVYPLGVGASCCCGPPPHTSHLGNAAARAGAEGFASDRRGNFTAMERTAAVVFCARRNGGADEEGCGRG